VNKVLPKGAGGGPKPPTVHAVTYVSEDIFEINLGVCVGPIAGLYAGPRAFYLGDTPLTSPTGENNFDPFELHVHNGADVATPVHNALGGISSSESVSVQLGYLTPVVRETDAGLRNQIDVLEIRLFISQLVNNTSSGDILKTDISVDLEYREKGTTTWLPFIGDNKTWTYNGRIGGAVKEFRRVVPRINADWELRVTKSLDDDTTNGVYRDVSWESFQSVIQEDKAYNNTVIVRGLSAASDQLNSVPNMAGVWRGLIVQVPSNYDPVTRYYDGVWDGSFKLAYTDNPVWCLYYLLMDPVNGARAYFPGLQTDRFSFYEAAQWCDGLVPRGNTGTYQPRYTYNDLISQVRQGRQTLQYLAGLFGGVIAEDLAGTIILKVDKPSAVTQIFGPESVSSEGFSYSYTDIEGRPNQSKVQFTNPDLQWDNDQRLVEIQEYIDRNGLTVDDYTAVGCIDEYEAQRRAYLRLLQANTETTMVSFSTARQGLLLEPYDVIGIADPAQNWGLSGRVKSVSGTTITLRDALTVPAQVGLTLQVQTPTGIETLTVQSATATTTSLEITVGTWPTNAPDRAQFSLEDNVTSTGLVKPFRILSIEPNEEESSLANISAIEVNPNKHSDADNLTLTQVVDYTGVSAIPRAPQNIRIVSGTSESLTHQDGTIENRILVTWDAPSTYKIRVYYRREESDEFQVITASQNQVYIPMAKAGEPYLIEFRGENEFGIPFQKLTPILHQVTGKRVDLQTPTNWVGIPGVRSVTLDGPDSTLRDFAYFEVWAGEAGSVFENASKIGQVAASLFTYTLPAASLFARYWVLEVDTSGNPSAPSNAIDVLPEPVKSTEIEAAVTEQIEATRAKADAVRADHDALILNFTKTNLGELEVDYNATQAAANDALVAATASEADRLLAEAAANVASVSETNAAASSISASASEAFALAGAVDATDAANAANASETNAAASETNAANSSISANASEAFALAGAVDATDASVIAENAKVESIAARNQSETYQTASLAAQAASELARNEAQTQATSAAGSATASAGHAQTAQASETASGSNATAAQAAQVSAEAARDQSSNTATASSASAAAAAASETAAGSSAAATALDRQAAQTARAGAETAETNAATSETNASGSAATATTEANNAATSETNAGASATAAAGSASTASTKATEAGQDATAANAAKLAAQTARAGAETAESNAATSETSAAGSAASASSSATNAATSENNAGSSATAAASSASLASTKATESSQSATAANTAKLNAETARAGAETAETNAATSETSAAGSAATASTSASNSAASETAAGGHATAAATSASVATTKAGEASQSATTATTQANTATTKAGEASTSATNAATSETGANNSAASALISENAAATSETASGIQATASANSAGVATTKATEAAQSASAADVSKTAAETAKSNAESSETAAALSASNASGSEAAAGTSETNAAASETASGSSATAAASSASLASTKATEAGQDATAANASRLAAETAESNASVSEASAAQSSTDATGSASSAQTSSVLSSVTFDESLKAAREGTRAGMATVSGAGNGQFQQGWTGWITITGLTTNFSNRTEIETGVLFGDDGATIASIDLNLELTQIVRAGEGDIVV